MESMKPGVTARRRVRRGGRTGAAIRIVVVLAAALVPRLASGWQCEYTEPFEVVASRKPFVAHVRIESHVPEFGGVASAELPWKPGVAEVLGTFKGELPGEITLLNAPALESEFVMALEPVDGPISFPARSNRPGGASDEGQRTLVPPDHTYSYGMTFLSCEELLLPVRDGLVEGYVYVGSLNRVLRLFGFRGRSEPDRVVPLSRVRSLVAR